MNSSIYDLSYDFVQQNGHYLVLTEKEKQPIQNDELVPLQIKMIESNQIPYLLPIKVVEMDFRVRLHYEITSKRMLSLFLREKTMSMDDYYGLFLKIIAALEESQLYLLDQERYVLKEDFIFIGKTIHDVHLTYLPFHQIPEKAPFEEDLKALLINIGGEIQGLEGEGFQSILNYAKDPGFHLKGLKELLLELRSGSHSFEPPSYEKKPDPIPLQDPEPERPLLFEQSLEREPPQEPIPEFQPMKASQKKTLPALTQREKILMGSFALVVLALIWKFYGVHPSQSLMDVCAGLSLLVVAAVFIYWKVWRPGQTAEFAEDPISTAAVAGSGSGIRTDPQFSSMNQWQKASPNPASPKQNKGNYYDHLHQNTTLLSHSDDTVMLNEAGGSQTPENPYLLIKREGESEKVEISRIPFVIGRNPATVQYVEDTAGVSRNHLEITKGEGVCSAKDLGSRNGSQLNGQPMVPYKWYALNDEDELVIGNVPMTFRAGFHQ